MSKTYTFKGWIPSSRGRISHSRFGYCDIPYRSVCANHSDSKQRTIVVRQCRKLLDGQIPAQYMLRSLFGTSGKMYFVCVANSVAGPGQPGNSLDGMIYLFFKRTIFQLLFGRIVSTLTQGIWKGSVRKSTKKIQKKMIQNQMSTPQRSLDGDLANEIHNLKGILDLQSTMCFEFRMMRDGEITFEIQEEYVRGLEIDLLDENKMDVDEKKLLDAGNQFYYFLKDIAHRHQHHDPKTDSLIALCPQEETDPPGELDEVTWRRSVFRSLHEAVLQAKNPGKSDDDCIRALGILAYADVFKSLATRSFSSLRNRFGVNSTVASLDEPLFGPVDHETFRRSLQSSINEMEVEHRRIHKLYTNLIVFGSGPFMGAIWLAALGGMLHEFSGGKLMNMTDVFNSETHHVIILLVILILLFVLAALRMAIGFGRVLDGVSSGAAGHVIQALPRWWSISLLSIAAVAMMYISIEVILSLSDAAEQFSLPEVITDKISRFVDYVTRLLGLGA